MKSGEEKIRRADLDGGNKQTLLENNPDDFGWPGPTGLALDVANGKMYWVDISYSQVL